MLAAPFLDRETMVATRPSHEDLSASEAISIIEHVRDLLRDLRTDFRDELAAHNTAMIDRMDRIEREFRNAGIEHAQDHLSADQERADYRSKLEALLRETELAKARRDGMLGIVRFTFDLVGRDWRVIAIAIAAALTIIGNVRVSVSN